MSLNLLVVCGSPRREVCSIGAFARAEALAMQSYGFQVETVEPNSQWCFEFSSVKINPQIVLMHIPSLHDRKNPFNMFLTALRIRFKFPKAKLFANVHEFFEAPWHFKFRVFAFRFVVNGFVVNTTQDEDYLKRFQKNVFKYSLGPTLWDQDLLNSVSETEVSKKISEIKSELKLSADPQLLYSGLITPGKGLEFVIHWAKHYRNSIPFRLNIAGAFGPKARDVVYAESIINELQALLGDRFYFYQSPSDEVFKKLLIANDLVILPFDTGVTERRSSFLAAASCGANIWTTVGENSSRMLLDQSGAFLAALSNKESLESNLASAVSSLSDNSNMIQRRIKNLIWSKTKSWQARCTAWKRYLEDQILS